MAAQLANVSPDEYVVELGPGTGVITRAICQTRGSQDRLVVIERDARFAEQLKKDFPQMLVLQGDARDLRELLQKNNINQVAAIICCLPLLAMPDSVRHGIVDAAFESLKPDGAFILYTYGLASPVSEHNQRKLGIRGKVTKRVWRNFPPAKIWRYTSETL